MNLFFGSVSAGDDFINRAGRYAHRPATGNDLVFGLGAPEMQ